MPAHVLFVADVIFAGERLFAQSVKFVDRGGDHRRRQSAAMPLGRDKEQVEQRAICRQRNHRRAGEVFFVRFWSACVRAGGHGQAGGRSGLAMFAREIMNEVSVRGFGYLLPRVAEISMVSPKAAT